MRIHPNNAYAIVRIGKASGKRRDGSNRLRMVAASVSRSEIDGDRDHCDFVR